MRSSLSILRLVPDVLRISHVYTPLRYTGFFGGSVYSNVNPTHNTNPAIPFHNDSTSAKKYNTLVNMYLRVR
jgi:hypothetical protein